MSVWRFSLIGLLAAVTFAAVACGAMVNPNEWWTIGVTSATVALLAFAVLAAIYGAGVRRAFWGGAAIVGWGYFGLVAFSLGFNLDNYGSSPLVTCKLLRVLGESRLDQNSQTSFVADAGLSADVDLIAFTTTSGYFSPRSLMVGGAGNAAGGNVWAYFYTIGHCLWSLFLAALGGLVAMRLALARERMAS